MNKRERRYLPHTEIRVQVTESGEKTIAGYAVVYNSLSEDMGFKEMVAPGAFDVCLASNPDVRCFFNHDDSRILGRTASKTLTIANDATGLSFRCILPNTTSGNDVAVSIERGDITGCSFGFVVTDDEWEQKVGYVLRTIKAATIFEVSPVIFPAYEATSVTMRSLFPDGAIDVPTFKDPDGHEVPATPTPEPETRDDAPDDAPTDQPVNPDPAQDDTDADEDSGACGCECDGCEGGDCELCSAEPCTADNCDCTDYRTNKTLADLITRRLR